MAIIKADAYGHGMVSVAQALAGADAFGVACLDEALILRTAGIAAPITLLEGFYHDGELPLISEYRLAVVIHDRRQIEILEHSPIKHPIRVWLKVDSGMHRLGFEPGFLPDAWHRLQGCAGVIKPLGFITHFGCADELHHPLNPIQWERFRHTVQGLGGEHSLANSAAILRWPETHADWVRPGIMLYGISPFSDGLGPDHGLRPVMTLRSHLMTLRRCKQGEAIGYGASWRCPEDMPIGIVAIGYGDGYPRHVPPGTPVLVNGKRVPLIGRVSMDMLYVDLRTQPEARVGDPVVLWGPGLPVEEIARHANTIPYELACQVTPRVPRVFVEDMLMQQPGGQRAGPPALAIGIANRYGT